MNSKPVNPSSAWRMSLRELLVIVALLAVGCVALKFASTTVVAISGAVALAVSGAMAIYAFVGRGPGQAFAIGFAVIAIGFSCALYMNEEHSTRWGEMLTEQALMSVHEKIATKWVMVFSTDEPVRPFDPTVDSSLYDSTQFSSAGPTNSGNGLYVAFYPSKSNFIDVGNAVWKLILGYLGGKFAVWVYLRRLAREQGQEI